MKKQIMFYALLNMIAVTALCQSEENPPPPPEDSPLMQLVKSEIETFDFNALREFENYGNTEDDDLKRKTSYEHIVLASQQRGKMQVDLPAEVFSVDNNDFNLSGYATLRSLSGKNIIVGNDTVFNTDLIIVEENYRVRRWLDTITRYKNTYYSFLKNGVVVLEVFNKNRTWVGNLNQSYEGVSINKVGENPPIVLTLSPNPASTNCTAQFNLYSSGQVLLHFVNQDATFDKEILDENLQSGSQSIPFSVEGLTTGVYTVFLQFDNAVYSSNLVIQ